ncbi:MAG: hypothetical protein NW200_05140 [Hyphomonadaceae bacterium]|nr:hypothetical protein [Hyphomonadaceae bacterium]
MLRALTSAFFAAWLLAAPAQAEVVASAPTGFVVKQVVSVPVQREEAYRRFIDIASWWESDHTFSGDAANMSITPRADGCWCEKLKDRGFVRHMAVVYAAPGETIRFAGGLGPLQEMAVSGAMTVAFVADGPSTTVTLTYAVGGYAPAGLASLAPIVDGVLGAQMLRYREAAGRRRS